MRRVPALWCALVLAVAPTAACSSAATAGGTAPTPAATSPAPPGLGVSPTPEASGAEVQVGGGIPESWPAAVPLPDGGTLQTYTLSEDGRFLNAVFILDGSVEEVAGAYDAALVAAGYTVTTSDVADGVAVADYTGPQAEINATAADGAGKTNLFVNVTLASAG
jgi:hypothetical protein